MSDSKTAIPLQQPRQQCDQGTRSSLSTYYSSSNIQAKTERTTPLSFVVTQHRKSSSRPADTKIELVTYHRLMRRGIDSVDGIKDLVSSKTDGETNSTATSQPTGSQNLRKRCGAPASDSSTNERTTGNQSLHTPVAGGRERAQPDP